MQEEPPISLKDYLRLSNKRQKNPLIIDEYDDFILKVWAFFELRATAENNYKNHWHLAKNARGALPLQWKQVASCLERTGGPPITLVTQIAKLRYGDVDHIVHNLRKVLCRVRQKESLSKVQQIDAHCLRWLTRQPGRSPIEKAGSRQEILAVSRIENFDTLENRVLRDFLLRASSANSFYLRKYAPQFPEHELIRTVARFNNLCVMGLSLPVMDQIRSLYDLPQPNYVLQQDARYSKIWIDYCKLIRQEEIAEKLWSRRESCLEYYDRCLDGLSLQCSTRARFQAPLWFNELDGRNDILDAPWWRNEEGTVDIREPTPPSDRVAIIDLTSPWDKRMELVYGFHDNAKPFIQNPHRPNVEPQRCCLSLREIIRRGRVDGDTKWLRDYFEQLKGLIGGEEWIILVPDDWDPQWLDMVRRSCPLPRSRVSLLWRSIAVVLGCCDLWAHAKEGDSFVVVDGNSVPDFVATKLIFKHDKASSRILPQRASFRIHGKDRFALGTIGRHESVVSELAKESNEILCSGYLSAENFPMRRPVSYVDSNALVRGVKCYLREKREGKISYFDELEAFTVILTTANEEVKPTILIKHDECWPGMKAFHTEAPVRVGTLAPGESLMRLYMFEGEPSPNSRLKLYKQEFDSKTTCAEEISLDAEMTPGQGLAIITLHADFLDDDVELALHDKEKLLNSDMTILRIERELKRHFPPNMPLVEACDEIWNAVEPAVMAYARTKRLLDNGMFAKAQSYWGVVDETSRASSGIRRYGQDRIFDETTMSPIDRLKREKRLRQQSQESSAALDT